MLHNLAIRFALTLCVVLATPVLPAAEFQPGDTIERLPTEYEEAPAQYQYAESTPYLPSDTQTWPHNQRYDHAGLYQDGTYQWSAVGRSYYMNDQRIEFTGQEATFAVEGVVRGSYTRRTGEWETSVLGELFLTQPYDRNMLVDTAERRSYRSNFEIEPLEIQQLFFSTRYNDFLIGLGKMPTPFGRTYFPILRNDFSDAPFIRTESILWRETGGLVQYDPGPMVFSMAITNGGPERDANSSKALVARAGWDGDGYAFGASVKEHDGVGSENQKTYKSHVGIDGMVRMGRWTLSGEAIYDKYGLKRPSFNPENITWGRSIYYRDVNFINAEPIHGVGYYANLGYEGENWDLMFNYGEFDPQEIGIPQHDVTTRRGIAKAIYHLFPQGDVFVSWIQETDLLNAQDGRHRKGTSMLIGVQFGL